MYNFGLSIDIRPRRIVSMAMPLRFRKRVEDAERFAFKIPTLIVASDVVILELYFGSSIV